MKQLIAKLLCPYHTAQEWSLYNPVLAKGEIGVESDTNLFKIGDGASSWNNLGYAVAEGGGGSGGTIVIANPGTATTNELTSISIGGVPYNVSGKDGRGISSAAINSSGALVITYTDGTVSNLGVVKGADGANGKDGADGYTPIKGTDYWTAADQAAIVSEVLATLPEYRGEVEYDGTITVEDNG